MRLQPCPKPNKENKKLKNQNLGSCELENVIWAVTDVKTISIFL